MNANEESEVGGIQVDLYGVKTKVIVAEDEPPPATWREVERRVNVAAMRIATGAFELPAELLAGATRFVRGVTALPDAIVRRVAGAHAEADREEERRAKAASRISVEEADANLEAVLLDLRSRGLHVEPFERADGQPVIIAVRPELADHARALAARPQGSLPATAELKSAEENDAVAPATQPGVISDRP